jgi:hypothetical protein
LISFIAIFSPDETVRELAGLYWNKIGRLDEQASYPGNE